MKRYSPSNLISLINLISITLLLQNWSIKRNNTIVLPILLPNKTIEQNISNMDMEHLVLNNQNTENGEMPQLPNEEKEQIKTVRILESNNLNCIPDEAFHRWSSLESVDIEDGANITIIGEYAFCHCKALRSLNLPNTVITVGEDAFIYCSSLESINIPNGVTAIGWHAFRNCKSLQLVNIPIGVKTIEDGAFWGCQSLKSVNVPNGVTRIGDETFQDCSSLQSVHIPNSVTEIGFDALDRCDR